MIHHTYSLICMSLFVLGIKYIFYDLPFTVANLFQAFSLRFTLESYHLMLNTQGEAFGSKNENGTT